MLGRLLLCATLLGGPVVVSVVVSAADEHAPPASETSAAAFDTAVRPFLFQNCYQCHNDRRSKGDLSLKQFQGPGAVVADPNTWEKVLLKIRTGEMPPEDEPRPPAWQVAAVARWIDEQIEEADRTMIPDPGRVTIRRLNRTEYNNTIRDLLAVDSRPADDFPQDDTGYGFDNIGDVLSLPPVLMERYLVAAERVVREALHGLPAMKPTLVRRQPRARHIPPRERPPASYDATGLSLPQAVHAVHRFPVDGEYTFRIVAGGTRPASSEPVTVALWIDGREAATARLDPEEHASFFFDKQDFSGKFVEVRLRVSAGEHEIAAALPRLYEGLPARFGGLNSSSRPAPALPAFAFMRPGIEPERMARRRKAFDERLAEKPNVSDVRINYIDIGGPYNQTAGPSAESRRRIFTCGHAPGSHLPACRRRIVSSFMRRAFRRPVTPAEVNGFVSLARAAGQQGESFEDAIGLALQAVLVSPDFLFRIERDRAVPAGRRAYTISEHELATRLSYFLWASMPDARLRRLAVQGGLRAPGVLDAEVRRMLQDPKARSLVEEFGGQWLQVRALESVAPDKDRFPDFDDYLRLSMRRETDLFFERIVREDRSILDFLRAQETFVNERLARHYGLQGVSGPAFRRVSLPGPERGGVLTHASVLTVSSYATRTSPVLRGKWILENLLDAPPKDPPPGVVNLEEAKTGEGASVREQLEAHLADPTCAACHRRMDPLGFGLEHYDAIGRWRDEDGGGGIDASGRLPDGRTFEGPAALRAILADEEEAFTKALASKLLTYALGRGLQPADRQTVRTIARAMPSRDYRFSGLVLEIVTSPQFQMRRGAATP